MTDINKANALIELNTLISGLTVATETSSELVLILKTADIAGADSSSIKTEILSRLNAANNSTAIDELAVLIAGLPLVTADRSISVTSITDLSSLAVDPGTIVFVTEENLPYVYRSDDTWVILFPTTQPSIPLENSWAWGSNGYGRLGDGTTVDKSSPVSVVGGFTDWIQVNAGSNHSLGIKTDGTAWAWGLNLYGRLGDGTTTSRRSPVSILGGFTDWVQVSGGNLHSLGIRANGTAWAWGYGIMLGDGTTISKRSPVSVVGGFTDWVQVSAGGFHSLGLRADGTAWGWGAGTNGQLGDNATAVRTSPVSVVGGFTDWVQVNGSGSDHSLGLRADGTAWAWGGNAYGKLGDGTTVSKSSPVPIVGGFTDWTQVNSGKYHSLGLRANGTAWAWGYNNSGRLGDGTTSYRSSPVSVVGGFTDWVQVTGGGGHSLGVRSNGTAWAWGQNVNGELGDGTILYKTSPISVIGGFTDWVQVSAGEVHNLGIRGG